MFCCWFKKKISLAEELSVLFAKIKDYYMVESIDEARKQFLSEQININGYLPYPYIKALEELTEAEVIFALELKFKLNNVYEGNQFCFKNDEISPAVRAGFENAEWIKKEQHNIKVIDLAGLGNGNKTQEPGKFIDWLRQLLILPAGRVDKGVLATSLYLIPFHPREFGCAYLPTSSGVSPHIVDKGLVSKLQLGSKEQIKTFIQFAQLAGHSVIYDVLPQTGRFSKIVLANPHIARWIDVNHFTQETNKFINEIAKTLQKQFETEDIEIVKEFMHLKLKGNPSKLGEHYNELHGEFEALLAKKRQELAQKTSTKQEQQKIHKHAKDIIAITHKYKPNKKLEEQDITKQPETIKELISQGLWPLPGGAWCSAGIPVFERMSDFGEYPIFKHYDFKGQDVSHFANLDCQTPFYFAHLELKELNTPVIDYYINHLKQLKKDYNFDGFRLDHVDHIVDDVSEQAGVPISYRIPKKVLGQINQALKSDSPQFVMIAEYMLWDKYYKQYHQDMGFDSLWGDDIVCQFEKTPTRIVEDNQELATYNKQSKKNESLSIFKTYNNQDGEFRAINQYPGQLGEQGALFKWFKYKFLPGGKFASRPIMFIDGDESFTKTGMEGVICAEVSMARANNENFFNKFNAINKFALDSEFTLSGEAEIITQEDDGFIVWMVSKDPLKECLLVVANYNPPYQNVIEQDELGIATPKKTDYEPAMDKKFHLPGEYKVVSEYEYSDKTYKFEEKAIKTDEKTLVFEKLNPSEFKFFKISKA